MGSSFDFTLGKEGRDKFSLGLWRNWWEMEYGVSWLYSPDYGCQTTNGFQDVKVVLVSFTASRFSLFA